MRSHFEQQMVQFTDANTPMNRSDRILAVLLAAGAGSRFGGSIHKLRYELNGESIVTRALRAMTSAEIGPCLVVTGAVDIDDLVGDVPQLHNAAWRTGQRSSVVTAIEYAQQLDFDAIVFGLGDQPFIEPDAWRAVAETNSPLVVATYDGQRGNPVKIDKSLWEAFVSLDDDPDAGLRILMRLRPELVKEVACKGNSTDIDTPEDLLPWT